MSTKTLREALEYIVAMSSFVEDFTTVGLAQRQLTHIKSFAAQTLGEMLSPQSDQDAGRAWLSALRYADELDWDYLKELLRENVRHHEDAQTKFWVQAIDKLHAAFLAGLNAKPSDPDQAEFSAKTTAEGMATLRRISEDDSPPTQALVDLMRGAQPPASAVAEWSEEQVERAARAHQGAMGVLTWLDVERSAPAVKQRHLAAMRAALNTLTAGGKE